MKVLVTGGAGFIGSNLCESLFDDGFYVICADNLSSGKKENVAHLLKNKRFEFVKHDVCKPLNIKVDYIFHLASRASPVDFSTYPIDILMANSLGTYNVLKLAQSCSARVVYASSSEVYGDPHQHPQTESYWGNVNPVGPRSCYDEGKRVGEAICVAFYRKYSLDVRIARIFNTYGPRMRADDGRVVPTFIVQALKNKPITIYGKGRQTRSFCYVSDMVDGLKRLMFKGSISGQIVNLGNPNEIKILSLAKTVKKMAGSESKIVFESLPKDDPARRRPDIAKAKGLLGWECGVKLEEGLDETIKWFKSTQGKTISYK